MQIYSTTFPVKETLKQDEFIKLVIEWNQGSPHNKMKALDWNGERNVRFEEGNLSLEIEELRAYNTIAARFRHVDTNGIMWTNDFVLNFRDRKLAIKLDREATLETKRFIPTFKPPHLVNMILEKDYADIDNDLEITSSPIIIDRENYYIIENAILKKEQHWLPIVYVTKTWAGRYPLNVGNLAYRLRGVAHVLKEVDSDVSFLLKECCNGENVHHGGIGIYYPSISARNKNLNTARYAGYEEGLEDKVVNMVCRYMNQQAKERMYTWEGVQNELLRLKNESLLEKRKAAENEKADVYEIFDATLKEQADTIETLTNRVASLEQENQGLHAKLDGMDELPLLFFGEEDELYEGEIREIVLDILNEQFKNTKEKSRRAHILEDIINNNKFEGIPEEKRNTIKRLLKGSTKVNGSLLQELKEFGFDVTKEGKHYKLTYYKDRRYCTIMANTGSDSQRGGTNLAMEIIREML